MKKHFILYNILSILTICIGCQEQDMMNYGNDPAIYFANETFSYGKEQKDSIKHSFFVYGENVLCDTVRILVRTMGAPTDYDRPIKIVQTNAGQPGAAIAGIHYIPFDNPEICDSICIPAGEVKRFIPIVLLRDKSLANERVRMELTLESNEHFRQGIDKWRNFLLTTTDMAEKPNNWDTAWRYTFGASWGTEKMRFIIKVTGYTDFDNPPSDMSYKTWLGDTAKQALLEYNLAHPDNPLCEADGTPVSFDK